MTIRLHAARYPDAEAAAHSRSCGVEELGRSIRRPCRSTPGWRPSRHGPRFAARSFGLGFPGPRPPMPIISRTQNAIRSPAPLQMGEVAYLRAKLPADAIITNGAGNFATWSHRFISTGAIARSGSDQRVDGLWRSRRRRGQARRRIGIVVSVQRRRRFHDERPELATAVQYGANVIFLVINNGMYGTIRMHQEKPSGPRPGRNCTTRTSRPGASLWRPWRDGEDHGGIRPGLRARACRRKAGPDRNADRSRRHHAQDEPEAKCAPRR